MILFLRIRRRLAAALLPRLFGNTLKQSFSLQKMILTELQAVEIFRIKQWNIENEKGIVSIRGLSQLVSKVYGVSARTIRDIWNQKTWAYATNDQTIDTRLSSGVQVVLACYKSGYERT